MDINERQQTTPAAPRVWHRGDTIPSDVHAVIDEPGYRWERSTVTSRWLCEDEDFEGLPFSPEKLLIRYGPVTEANA